MKQNLAIFFAYVLGVVAIVISLWRCEPFELDAVSVLANILTLMVTILLGIIAYNYFIQKDESEKFKKEMKELLKNETEERKKQIIKLQEQLDNYGMKVIDSPEWGYLITDPTEKYLIFGIRHDGTIEWSKGIPEPIRVEIEALKKRIAELEK